jgi:hypothetical protein
MLLKWRNNYAYLPSEFTPETSVMLYLIEGLHASCQACRKDSVVYKIFQEENDEDDDKKEVKEVDKKNNTATTTTVLSNETGRKRKVTIEPSTDTATTRTTATSIVKDEGLYALSLRQRSTTTDTLEFNQTTMVNRLGSILKHYDITDLMGFKPSSNKLPLAPRNHCGYCSYSDNSTNAKDCKSCQHELTHNSVDYGNLTDAIVWAYVFRDIGIDTTLLSNISPLESIAQLLPLARCYQRIDELGVDFFKLQCYFLTHLIYAFSDWGQHALHRQLYAEEFRFILENFRLAVEELKDPEIVGEFLQCLKILQFTPQADPMLVDLVLLGKDITGGF